MKENVSIKFITSSKNLDHHLWTDTFDWSCIELQLWKIWMKHAIEGLTVRKQTLVRKMCHELRFQVQNLNCLIKHESNSKNERANFKIIFLSTKRCRILRCTNPFFNLFEIQQKSSKPEKTNQKSLIIPKKCLCVSSILKY